MTQKELNEFLDFCGILISDSPHAGDDKTYKWFDACLEKVRVGMPVTLPLTEDKAS